MSKHININEMLQQNLPWTNDDTMELYHTLSLIKEDSNAHGSKKGIGRMQIQSQGKALAYLIDGETWKEIPLINIYGAIFRELINKFEKEFNIVPTPEDFISFAAQKTGEDPKKVADALKPTIKDQINMR